MDMPVTILISLLASTALTIGKAVLVSRLIRDGLYSHRSLAIVSVLFLAMTAPSIASECGYLGCGWSLRFAWVPAALDAGLVMNSIADTQIILVATVIYAILSVYFFGHLLGWALYALSCTRNLIG